jgi:hypothetical protein
MESWEQQKAEIEARLAEAPAGLPDVHPNIAEHYRAKVIGRAETLAEPESNGEAREDIRALVEDVGAGIAAENSEFVLQANDLKSTSVQGSCGASIFLTVVVPDLQDDGRRIVIGLIVVGHRHDAGLQIWSRIRDRALQIGRERCNPAAARQRIADQRNPAGRRHVRASAGAVHFGSSGAVG